MTEVVKRFRFSLRTLFLVVTVVAIACPVANHYYAEWLKARKRQELLKNIPTNSAAEPAIRAALLWLKRHGANPAD